MGAAAHDRRDDRTRVPNVQEAKNDRQGPATPAQIQFSPNIFPIVVRLTQGFPKNSNVSILEVSMAAHNDADGTGFFNFAIYGRTFWTFCWRHIGQVATPVLC